MIRYVVERLLGILHLDWERVREKFIGLFPAGMVAAGSATGLIHSVDVIASAITHVIGAFFTILGLIMWIRRQIRRRRAAKGVTHE